MTIKTILTPAELPALAQRDLHATDCVVFDILRATSTFVTALHHGAKEIIPVSEIPEAITLRHQRPDVLLAGERDGIKIRAAQSGGIDFDFGNSPREFTPDAVRGKTIVSTTTNGTRALRACTGAKCVLASSFLNLAATAKFLQAGKFSDVLLVCAGMNVHPALMDSSSIARQTFHQMKAELGAAIGGSQNGRRLAANPELRGDVAFCAQRNIFDLVAVMGADGSLRRG
jgi:2-phosphosulfolactate phosphatase